MLHRRDFLKALTAVTAGLMVADSGCSTVARSRRSSSDKLGPVLPQRRLGRTGAAVTMLGLGGHHLGAIAERSESEAQETIEAAIEGGVRFFDNAETYSNRPGSAEEAYGRLLIPKYRDHIFLMTKAFTRDGNTGRDVPEVEMGKLARRHLETSLRRMKTDYLDLWQIHSLQSPRDAEARINGGVLDVALDAQRKGLTRFIGFTGHVSPHAMMRMIELMKEHNDALQTCQMPINVLDPNYLSFIDGVLPALVEREYGVLAMKTLAGGNFYRKPNLLKRHSDWQAVVPDRMSLEEAIHFVWSLPVSCLISGPDSPQQFREMIGLARSFTAMSEAMRKDLVTRVADLAGDKLPTQHIESYKLAAKA